MEKLENTPPEEIERDDWKMGKIGFRDGVERHRRGEKPDALRTTALDVLFERLDRWPD